jgi:hypothetical protein
VSHHTPHRQAKLAVKNARKCCSTAIFWFCDRN